MLNVLDLFSGNGGISLGLEWAGCQTTAFCEINPYCQQLLARHWPGVPIHDDIRQLDGTQYAGTVDLVCGGYPCQPFSAAGKQLGEADPRHLWPEMCRIIREVRPRWVIAENVRGHIGLGFDTVAAQLEDESFTVWPFVVPACAVGAPHRRDRLWIVAHAERGERRQEPHRGPHGRVGREQQSLPWDRDWESALRDFRGVDDGSAYGVDRIDTIRNGVVPQIPELLGRTILAYEQQLGLAA
jgi:DNA (cytosine-5)-methyltransferase 1